MKSNKSNPSPNDKHSERDLKRTSQYAAKCHENLQTRLQDREHFKRRQLFTFFLILEFVNKGMKSAQINFTPKDSSVSKEIEGLNGTK